MHDSEHLVIKFPHPGAEDPTNTTPPVCAQSTVSCPPDALLHPAAGPALPCQPQVRLSLMDPHRTCLVRVKAVFLGGGGLMPGVCYERVSGALSTLLK